jgi:hypothetical protein
LFNRDYLLAAGDCLGLHYRLGVGLKISCALSLSTQALDGVHHARLLRQECVSQIGGPLDIAGHPLHHVWKFYQ